VASTRSILSGGPNCFLILHRMHAKNEEFVAKPMRSKLFWQLTAWMYRVVGICRLLMYAVFTGHMCLCRSRDAQNQALMRKSVTLIAKAMVCQHFGFG